MQRGLSIIALLTAIALVAMILFQRAESLVHLREPHCQYGGERFEQVFDDGIEDTLDVAQYGGVCSVPALTFDRKALPGARLFPSSQHLHTPSGLQMQYEYTSEGKLVLHDTEWQGYSTLPAFFADQQSMPSQLVSTMSSLYALMMFMGALGLMYRWMMQ